MEKFTNIPKEKKQIIINSAYKVFSKNNYKKASTNEIVELSNISKGILFHYFKNKFNLYKYLFIESLNIVSNEIYSYGCRFNNI